MSVSPRFAWIAVFVGLGVLWLAFAKEPDKATFPAPIPDDRLHNAFWVHPKVISGAQPDAKGFQALKELGVRTVVSVDGARPDVITAKEHGLRYVHLPHGYDGVSKTRILELAKAVRDLPGPIYIHCHHGKHRSPSAAACACVAAGMIDPKDSLKILEVAGTSKNYRGLYQSVREALPLEARLLNELKVAFHESVKVPPMAEAMVAMEHTHDHLKTIAEAGWKVPAEHPDLEPVHEALLMSEHYTEMLRTDEAKAQPEGFLDWLRSGEEGAKRLRQALESWHAKGAPSPVPESVNQAFEQVNQSCVQCHVQYRNTPLQEKQ